MPHFFPSFVANQPPKLPASDTEYFPPREIHESPTFSSWLTPLHHVAGVCMAGITLSLTTSGGIFAIVSGNMMNPIRLVLETRTVLLELLPRAAFAMP